MNKEVSFKSSKDGVVLNGTPNIGELFSERGRGRTGLNAFSEFHKL